MRDEYDRVLYLGFLIGCTAAAVSYVIKKNYTRFNTALEIPKSYFNSKLIRGIVLDVADGDTIRLYHCPNLKPMWVINREMKLLKQRALFQNEKKSKGKYKLSDRTINVRLYGIDAPEIGHFGNANQPLSIESRDYLKQMILGKKVTLMPLKIDIYSRVIGVVNFRSYYFFKKDLSVEMIKNGFAQVYEGQDLVFHHNINYLQTLESDAKKKGVGVWSQSKKQYESPRDYKKRIRSN
ncbi:hypothetical protein BB560_004599 [Smittium megazygosporum]|uniref:TNase-like domain-containing protein n=1 Tax=Smittium megazygosporum TaxID=133381 RepID=A0A2T9Z8Z5_9FUNG|nr:hypothetical protein BB560_004599 [Smittium megazygosporum]